VRVARGQTGVESSGHAARVGVGQRAFPRAAPRAFVCGGVGWIPRRRREVVVSAPRPPENAPRAGSAVLSSKSKLRRWASSRAGTLCSLAFRSMPLAAHVYTAFARAANQESR